MREQFYYGHGKFLLSGEYLVLDGAKSLALPLKLGQSLSVRYQRSNNPKLYWKSYDVDNKVWFEATFELWHFNLLDNSSEEALVLQKILKQARFQNVHFLRDEADVFVETKLEFNRKWGLGSSSSLVYNIAQWAYVSAFELLQKTFGGSGYDIVCAQSMGPITYELGKNGPQWTSVSFNPVFKNNLYFVYLNKKQSTKDAISNYKNLSIDNKKTLIQNVNNITDQMVDCIDLKSFEDLIFEHENILSEALGQNRVKDLYFNDFWGAVKSLGAWGGDFVLVTSDKDKLETKDYFRQRGYDVILSYDDIVCQNLSLLNLVNNKVEESVYEIQ